MTHPALPQPEVSLGKYHIVRPLKVGGTAAIYLAVLRGENNFSREVVIKRPLPHLVSDNRARLMFIDEAHIASRLSHPNICQVLDLVSREDELYLVLEYLKGVDLREVLKRSMELGRLMPPEVCVWIGIEVCAGLDFAHEAVAIDGSTLNLIHRDVSPKNIRVTDSGSVKVIDFGIARAMNRATETAVGTIKGTLGYMSPEQILGDEIDRRSDIFAFGICLFQMLTCRNPFDGPTLKERVRRLTQAPVPSVREFNGALDDEIEGIVAKCLQRDVNERYQRMRDVQRDLDRYLAKLQTSSPRQRLIHFLEELFPGLHENDAELKVALTEISSVTGRIDTAQRLRFPDDEGARPASVATRSTVKQDSTISTVKDAAFAATNTRVPPDLDEDRRTDQVKTDVVEPATLERPELGDTAQLRDTAQITPRTLSESEHSSTSTALAARSMPWRALGLMFVLIAAVVAVIVVRISDRWSSQPLADRPIEEHAVEKTETSTRAAPGPVTAKKVAETKVADAKEVKTVAKTIPRDLSNSAINASGSGSGTSGAASGHNDHSSTDRARLYFKTALRLEREGRTDDALLMYTLAFRESGRKVDPSILRNLGLLHNKNGDVAKARACFKAYLDRNAAAADADRIRTLLSSFPPAKSVACVDNGELGRAKKAASRNGAMIEAWVDETLAERLR